MNEVDIRNIIEQTIVATLGNLSVDGDTDLFSVGVSSLSVVNFQMAVEESLKYSVSTNDLMGNPTINSWIKLYKDTHSQMVQAL